MLNYNEVHVLSSETSCNNYFSKDSRFFTYQKDIHYFVANIFSSNGGSESLRKCIDVGGAQGWTRGEYRISERGFRCIRGGGFALLILSHVS